MGELLTRRRELILSSSGGGGVEYVTDGLIMWLDGINNTSEGHNPGSNIWEDLSGNGHHYTYASANTINNDHLQTNGVGNTFIGFSADESSSIKSGKTIEIVIAPSSLSAEQFLFGLGNHPGTCFTKSGNICFSASSAKKSVKMLSGVHYYNSSLWRDGVLQSNTNVNDSWGNVNNSLFRYAYGGWSYQFNGMVYAIRIYNRTLTDAELMQNWLMDKARFGIA